MATKLLNLMSGSHPDYRVEPKVGPIVLWHGREIDLRKVTEKDAEAMAADKFSRTVLFTDERVQRDTDGAKTRRRSRS